jgi:hypothetical protein
VGPRVSLEHKERAGIGECEIQISGNDIEDGINRKTMSIRIIDDSGVLLQEK